MASEENLDTVYTRSMIHHSCGYGLYQPTYTREAFPGACGYVDGHGRWHNLFNLLDTKAVEDLGLTHPKYKLQMAKSDREIKWDPKTSTKMTRHEYNFEGGVDEAITQGFGKVQAKISYSTTEDFGAVLLTTPNIERRGFSSDSPVKRWYKTNVKQLLGKSFKYKDEIEDHGLFVITETHATEKCSLNAWNDPSKEVGVGVGADAALVASVGVHGKYTASSHNEGWNHYNSDGKHWRVVFFCCLRFRSRKVMGMTFTSIKRDEQICRASAILPQEEQEEMEIDDGQDGVIKVEIERYGKLPDPVEEEGDESDELAG